MFKVENICFFLLLTLNIFHTFSSVYFVDFKQVNISREVTRLQLHYEEKNRSKFIHLNLQSLKKCNVGLYF